MKLTNTLCASSPQIGRIEAIVPSSVVACFVHKCLWLSGSGNHNNLGFEKSPTIVGTITY